MEALILSCSTGGGHNSAGRAIAEQLEKRGHKVTFMDPYHLIGKKAAAYIGDSYIKLVQTCPRLFGFAYLLGDLYRKHLAISSPVYWVNGKMAPYMKHFLSQNHFDVIIMTHMYPAHILRHLKEQGFPLPKTVLVATDYTCIPFMEETDCDYYAIPSLELAGEFCSYGIPRKKLIPCGIPVSAGFSQPLSREQVKARMGLEQEKEYLLLSGGSIGAGKISIAGRILEGFLKEQPNRVILVLCGNNQSLYRSLKKRYRENSQVAVMESTGRMADYLKACQVFISKPGGLSSTEAAVAGVPLVHISPIPGCEMRNVQYFSSHGMSISVRRLGKELIAALERLEQQPAADAMKRAQEACISRTAAEDLCNVIEMAVLAEVPEPLPEEPAVPLQAAETARLPKGSGGVL